MTQFYQLSLEKAIADYQLGKLTTFGLVDYYIKIKFAPGWKISIDPRKVIQELGITIHQFRRAIAKIRETISITLKITTQLVGKIPVEKPVTPAVNDVTPSVNQVTPSANCDPQTTNKISTSGDSPDIRSNIDHISLSKIEQTRLAHGGETPPSFLVQIPAEEREKFLCFANQKVDELPKRPTLPKRWIAANLPDLYSDFLKSSAPETQKTIGEKQFVEWYDLMRQLGHVVGQEIQNGVRMVEMRGGMWVSYERKSQTWTLEYLRKCIGGK